MLSQLLSHRNKTGIVYHELADEIEQQVELLN